MVIVVGWILGAIILGVMGDGREIGNVKAFFISLFFSPLIGAIFVATSPTLKTARELPPEVQQMIAAGDKFFAAGNITGALGEYRKVLAIQPGAPNTHFKVACVYSLQKDGAEAFSHICRAIEEGFQDYKKIMEAKELSFLRDQPSFQKFVEGGYKLSDSPKADTVSQLERLAKLREKGVLTEREFEEQKRKILAG